MTAEPLELGVNSHILAAGKRVLELFASVQDAPEQFPYGPQAIRLPPESKIQPRCPNTVSRWTIPWRRPWS
ncbi:hypothetical protein QZH47_26840 [Pseudomonas corrugata]